MSIIRTLRSIGAEVYNKTDINNGGCCVYAAKVGEVLEKLGYDVRIITVKPLGNDYRSSNKNDFKIKCPYKAEEILPVDFDHVGIAVKVKNSWYTHDALVTKRTLKRFGEWDQEVSDIYFTVKQAKAFAKEKYFWNPSFSRNSGGKIISHAIRKHLGSQLQSKV